MSTKVKGCLAFLSVGVLLSCSAGPSAPSTIRLLEEFDSGRVEGGSTEPVAGPRPTEWRFDAPEGDQPWKSGSGTTGLSVRDGFLTARSNTDIPILHVERTSGLENPEILHAVEVRMRVSDGGQLAVMFSDSEELNLNAVLGQTRSNAPGSWPLRSPLVAGDSIQTYTLTTQVTSAMQSSFPSSGIRHVLVRPTDVAGAEIEIESIRLIFRKEYLANIPSGVSWQGFADIFRETLVTRSPERVRFNLNLPDGAWFDLAVGTVEDGPVTFQVGLSRDGAGTDSEMVLLERTVTTPHRWESTPIDLEEFSGQRVSLFLSVRADTPRTLGFWGSPVIRARSVTSSTGRAEAELPQGVILIVGDTLRRDHLD
ncbi:MAG: hypothetical protein V3R94_03895, partial [Acidobacteriota bacterium]